MFGREIKLNFKVADFHAELGPDLNGCTSHHHGCACFLEDQSAKCLSGAQYIILYESLECWGGCTPFNLPLQSPVLYFSGVCPENWPSFSLCPKLGPKPSEVCIRHFMYQIGYKDIGYICQHCLSGMLPNKQKFNMIMTWTLAVNVQR